MFNIEKCNTNVQNVQCALCLISNIYNIICFTFFYSFLYENPAPSQIYMMALVSEKDEEQKKKKKLYTRGNGNGETEFPFP